MVCVSHLLVQVAVLLYDSDPGQHIFSVLCLEQVLTVRRGQPQHVLAFCVAVGDVNQAGLDADWLWVVVGLGVGGGVGDAVLLVLVKREAVASQHGVHLLPRPRTPAHTLQRVGERKSERERNIEIRLCVKIKTVGNVGVGMHVFFLTLLWIFLFHIVLSSIYGGL